MNPATNAPEVAQDACADFNGDAARCGQFSPTARLDRGSVNHRVIQELSQAMQREKRVPDRLPFYQAALNREFLVGTEMEAGMRFPTHDCRD